MIIPRWISGGTMESIVVSCPPWVVAVELKTPVGFPSNAPSIHSFPVESISRFICAIMLP